MKRKVAKVGKLRLSPNEETMLMKEEYERRRKLRLQQVREQQKYIALEIRQKVKQRREEQLHQLEVALRDEWQKAQDQKMKALEELYLSSLRAIGEGHRQAKENEPDLEALAKQAEERKQKAEKRHKKALKEQKYQKEKLLREQARLTDARKRALEVERKRAAKVASLPPPLPHPLENFEVKKTPAVKPYGADNFSVTRYHISELYIDRAAVGEQPDARLAAEEEGKRLEELHREIERERREQLEKAHLRGSHALKKVHLAQDREKLLKELEQMQSMDQMRRRQIAAQMPPQLFVPAYKRMEMKEEWQRELEFAFEDMYNEDKKMKGDLILQFEPQPLPAPSDRCQDNDLDISLEQEFACDTQPESASDTQRELEQIVEEEIPNESENPEETKSHQPPQSKLALKKLLNKIRSQKEEWTSKGVKEIQSETETIESGTIASEESPLSGLELNYEQQENTTCETKESGKIQENTVAAENSVLIHPQEQATKIRMEKERQKWYQQIEQQKQEQLALIKQIEEERARLEADFLKIQMQTCLEAAKKKREEEETGQLIKSHSVPPVDQQNKLEHEPGNNAGLETRSHREDRHLQTIHNYQHHLLQQNRLHKQTIEEARKHLQEYQNKLKQRYLSSSATPLSSVETNSVNLKPVSEPLLQRQEVQQTQYQSPGQAHTQECAWLLPVFSGAPHMSEKPASKREQQIHVCPDRYVQFMEAPKLKHRGFGLPCDCPSQERVGMLETSNDPIREPSRLQLPSGLVMKDVAVVRTQPEAHTQHVRFVLHAEDTSEPLEAVHFEESSQKMSTHQAETEAGEDPPLKTPLIPVPKGSHLIQAASVDSLGCQQEPAESTIKTSFEQPLSLPEPMTLSPEESKVQSVKEFLISKREDASLFNCTGIANLRDRVLASAESIQAQQKYLKELQEQLDARREALISRQKIQEQLLLQKQDELKEQIQRQQEALKEFLDRQVRRLSANEEVTEAQKPDWINRTDFSQVSENHQQENCGRSKFHRSEMISQCIGPAEQTEHSERVLCREQKWKSSKPPVTKVKLGLDLKQHELSVIPEVDTPKNCNVSFADKKDSVGREFSPVATTEDLAYMKHYGHAPHEEGSLPSSITDYREQIYHGSPRQSKQSSRLLQEVLLLTAENSYDSGQSQDSQVAQDSPVAAEVGGEVTTYSGPSFRLNNTDILARVASMNLGSEPFIQEIPCDLSSTISTGSFLTSETLDASPVDTGLSADSIEDGILRDTASCPWSSSLPLTVQPRQENLAGASEIQLPERQVSLYEGSLVQQISGKHTGDLNTCSGNNTCFKALTAELDFPEIEKHFPNFHHQVFQPLEPSLDSDASSSCSQNRIPQESREFSKTSTFSTKNQDMSTSLEVGNSTWKVQRSSLPLSLETNWPKNIASGRETVKENMTAGAEESFHPLQLETTLSNHCQNADQPVEHNAVLQRSLEQTPGTKKWGNENCTSSAGEYEELSKKMEYIDLQCSMEELRNGSLNPLEEQKSFYQLDTTPVTVQETFSPYLLKETVSSEKSPLKAFDKKYVKLPEKSVHVHEANKAVELDLQCNTNRKEPGQSLQEVQKSWKIDRHTNLKASDIHPQAATEQNGSLLETHENHSNSVPRSLCRIPVWETESGRGIMEEPELTLISSNDVSVAESDIEHTNQEKIKDKINNPACVDQSEFNLFTKEQEFSTLVPDTDFSVLIRPDGSSTAQNASASASPFPSHQTAVMLLEFPATPGSLQENFLKTKKNFIQKSLKRVERVKNRERENSKTEARQFQRGKSETSKGQKEGFLIPGKKGVVASQLNKVEVSCPEDRKSGGTEKHQHTSSFDRACIQLAEVKIRKEQQTKQETYARNREKTKEFQKKMLDKLRAKKNWKAP